MYLTFISRPVEVILYSVWNVKNSEETKSTSSDPVTTNART
jgi:hypothetical protein